MIRYALACAAGHEFEAWFGSSQAFDEQAQAGSIPCPVCGTARVAKLPMAPYVAKRRSEKKVPPQPDEQRRRSYALLRKLREELTADSDYVGPQFPEEARKIHYKEVEARGIYGEATQQEARELSEEGIPVYPLPPLPDELN